MASRAPTCCRIGGPWPRQSCSTSTGVSRVMLDPQTRDLLTEHLRPPDAYQLDYAVGTTFSLDLLALLVTPLSFALFDWEDESGQPTADITAIMQALRNYADR